MKNFKVGQFVLCIENSIGYLTKDKRYEIISTKENTITVKDDQGNYTFWHENRFIGL